MNALESEMQSLSDQQLAAKTAELKERAQGKGESLDSLLPEAFAVSARPRLLYIEQGGAHDWHHSTVKLHVLLPRWLHSIVNQSSKCWQQPGASQQFTVLHADHAWLHRHCPGVDVDPAHCC